MKLSNKVAIVTGASRGIGRATVQFLTEEGCNVVGVYEKSVELAKEAESENKNITMFQADVGDTSKLDELLSFTIKKFKKIDILVNNAGINLWGKIEEYSLSDWNRMLDVNVTAKYYLSKLVIPYLKNSDNGVIVNVSSRAGLNEYVFPEFIAYCVNNAAINNFTVALAKELKDEKIRVNAVIPTVTDTDRFRNAFTKEEQEEIKNAGKLGTSEEVAKHIVDLIKDTTRNGEIFIDKRVFIETEV
jgi:NAD(P)-dependent dehydrogenase (short-subunit alcohol dehydrogenase family)